MQAQLERIVAVEEIKQLKYRYLRSPDLKQWDEFADTFVAEATGDYGEGLAFGSRDALVGFRRRRGGGSSTPVTGAPTRQHSPWTTSTATGSRSATPTGSGRATGSVAPGASRGRTRAGRCVRRRPRW